MIKEGNNIARLSPSNDRRRPLPLILYYEERASII
jgi:hypothetical protein